MSDGSERWSSSADKRHTRSQSSQRDAAPQSELFYPTILNPIGILSQYRLFAFNQNVMKAKEKRIFLEQINELEAFETLKQLHNEIARLRLENKVFMYFLQENDPKVLANLNFRDFNHVAKYLQNRLEGNLNDDAISDISGKSKRHSKNIRKSVGHDTLSSFRTGRAEFKVTNPTKQNMAEKLLSNTTNRIATIIKNTKQEIFLVRAQKEELNLRLTEIENLKKNFLLHFADDENLPIAQIQTKYIDFSDKLIRNSSALVAQSRITFGSLDKKCKDLLAMIIDKRDLRKLLCGPDFQQLLIRKDKLRQDITEQTNYSHMLRSHFAAASAAFSAQKRLLKEAEDKHATMINHMESLRSSEEKLKKEIKHFDRSIKKRRDQMTYLKKQLTMWSAPTAQDLIDLKVEVQTLEKEIKILQRKIDIQRIQMPKKSIKK